MDGRRSERSERWRWRRGGGVVVWWWVEGRGHPTFTLDGPATSTATPTRCCSSIGRCSEAPLRHSAIKPTQSTHREHHAPSIDQDGPTFRPYPRPAAPTRRRDWDRRLHRPTAAAAAPPPLRTIWRRGRSGGTRARLAGERRDDDDGRSIEIGADQTLQCILASKGWR